MGALKKEKFTHKDYVQKKGRWELIDGKFYSMMPSPYPIHQRIVGRIFFEFYENFRVEELCRIYVSPIDWKIDKYNTVQPDVAIFCEKTEKQYFSKAPLLIVEVLSKATVKKDVTIKYDLYEKEGVQFYIIVYPSTDMAEIFELKNSKYKSLGKFFYGQEQKFKFKECKTKINFSNIFEKPEEKNDVDYTII